jgi:hypothetical protein
MVQVGCSGWTRWVRVQVGQIWLVIGGQEVGVDQEGDG